MEVRLRLGERSLSKPQEASGEPLLDVVDVRIDIHRKIEEVADGHARLAPHPGLGSLQHVQSLDDQHIGGSHDDLLVRHDVVGQV